MAWLLQRNASGDIQIVEFHVETQFGMHGEDKVPFAEERIPCQSAYRISVSAGRLFQRNKYGKVCMILFFICTTNKVAQSV